VLGSFPSVVHRSSTFVYGACYRTEGLLAVRWQTMGKIFGLNQKERKDKEREEETIAFEKHPQRAVFKIQRRTEQNNM
jgi:hypothetical protein